MIRINSKIFFSSFMVIELIALNVVAGQLPQGFVYQDHGMRDPFWPLVAPSGAMITYDEDLLISDLILEGVMIGKDGQNLAIVNGRILSKGNKIGQFIIEDISSESVVLIKGQEKFLLPLKKEE